MKAGTALLGFLVGVACGVAVTALLTSEFGVERAQRTAEGTPATRAVTRPALDSIPPVPTASAPPILAGEDHPQPALPALPPVDERLGLMLYGAVSDTSGAPVAADYGVIRCLPESGEALYARADEVGTYAVTRLRPGTWTVSTELTGYQPTTATLHLDAAQPVTRFDIVVEPAVRLLVLAITPDDRPLLDELSEPRMRLTAIATLEPPGELSADPSRGWNRYGVGEFIDRHRVRTQPGLPLSAPPGALGWLDVKRPLPVYVSLLLTGVVLATQRVDPGQSEVVFRIAPEVVMSTLASLTARFVDGFTQVPIEGVSLTFNVASVGDESAQSDADGVAHQDLLLAGRVELTAIREGYETLLTHVELAVGQHTDLGNVPLLPATTISGLVLDVQGRPLAAELLVLATDTTGPLPVDLQSERWSAQDDGTFTVGPLGRRRYVVRVEDDAVISAPALVDARGGDVNGLVLRAEPGQLVSVRVTWPSTVWHGVRLRGVEAGVWDELDSIRGPNVWTRRFAAGRYVAECCDGATVLQSVPFEVTDRPVTVTLSGP